MKQIIMIAAMACTFASCDKLDDVPRTYTVETNSSKLEWKGSAPTHFHTGSFDVSGSILTGFSGKIKGGNFVIPISSIDNYDLQPPAKQQLLDHLLSDDFFNAVLHPNAVFSITKVADYNEIDSSVAAGANYKITGNLSMLGKIKEISFPAKVTRTDEILTTEAIFNIDRTRWGMNSYTDPNAGLYILPDVEIKLNIRAENKLN